MNYCDVDDVVDRIGYITYKKVQSRFIDYICINSDTKREHFIDGWCCVTCCTTEGKVIPLLDVWAGFDEKYKNKIKEAVKEACKKQLFIKFVG